MLNSVSFKSGVKLRNRDTLVDDIQYWSGYGVVAPSLVTSNGYAPMVRSQLHSDELDEFDAWLKRVGYKVL